jgi:hypothetical protein
MSSTAIPTSSSLNTEAIAAIQADLDTKFRQMSEYQKEFVAAASDDVRREVILTFLSAAVSENVGSSLSR